MPILLALEAAEELCVSIGGLDLPKLGPDLAAGSASKHDSPGFDGLLTLRELLLVNNLDQVENECWTGGGYPGVWLGCLILQLDISAV